MKVYVAENIRKLRKERGLTQRELAEALGVTIGAVSKWENETAFPEIQMLADIATFFSISVDALMGYDLGIGKQRSAVKALADHTRKKNYDAGFAEAERYLIKYPNNFDIVHAAAQLYLIGGTELDSKAILRRALQLYERALDLIDQSSDPNIIEHDLCDSMAHIYLKLGEPELAIEKFKECNVSAVNDHFIGYIYAAYHRDPAQALPYLSRGLAYVLDKLRYICLGFSDSFSSLGDHQNALDITLWGHALIQGLKTRDTVSYLDKIDVLLLAGCARSALYLKDAEAAERYLSQAVALARRYDAAPSSSFEGIRFLTDTSNYVLFDDSGITALESIRRLIAQCPGETVRKKLKAMWKKVSADPVPRD